jgi:hypothetical protein
MKKAISKPLKRRSKTFWAAGVVIIIFAALTLGQHFLIQYLFSGPLAATAASQGEHADWHTVVNRPNYFEASYPCWTETNNNFGGGAGSYHFVTGCNYIVGGSLGQGSAVLAGFAIWGGPMHYPSDSTGQYALLRQTIESQKYLVNSGYTAETEINTILDGHPAVETTGTTTSSPTEAQYASQETRYWLFDHGCFYRVEYTRPQGSADMSQRFFASFKFTD